jgi:hypothetical protein
MMCPVVPAVCSAMGMDGVAPRFDNLERPLFRAEAGLPIVHNLEAKIDPTPGRPHAFRCWTMPHSRATGQYRRRRWPVEDLRCERLVQGMEMQGKRGAPLRDSGAALANGRSEILCSGEPPRLLGWLHRPLDSG